MTRRCVAIGAIVAVVVAAAPAPLHGQQAAATPRVGFVYPAGGQRGTTFRIDLGGQALNGVRGALVEGDGVRLRVLGFDRVPNAQRLAAIRDSAQALSRALRERGNDPDLRRRATELAEQLADWQRRRTNPALADRVTLEVSVDPGAPTGDRRLRLYTAAGLTNPLVFRIGELAEATEPATELREAREMAVTLPTTVNGRLVPMDAVGGRGSGRGGAQQLAGDVDRYRFRATAGQRVVAVVRARALIPYLGDAVPGWIQATLTLKDSLGHEVAFNDDHDFQPDPMLEYVVPSDGDYVLEIADALHRGRDDFVYRIAIGDAALVAGTEPPPRRARHPSMDGLTGPVEIEPNADPSTSQALTIPAMVSGRIDRPGDVDHFAFIGSAGDTMVAEVYARRLGSALDAVLVVTDHAGRVIARNDDHEDPAEGMETHHADPWLRVVLPSTGRFQVRVTDVLGDGGASHFYRLRVSPPRPDFELRVSPSSISVAAGGTTPVTVTAIRRDGFDGDIAVTLHNAPRGVVLDGAVVPAGQDRVRMTLTTRGTPGSDPGAFAQPLGLSIAGSAIIGGRTVTRDALPADEMMQAFFYEHLVVAENLWLSVTGRGGGAGGARTPARIASTLPVRLDAAGGTVVRVRLPPGVAGVERMKLRPSGAPEGITIDAVAFDGVSAEFTVRADRTKFPAGARGNLIVEIVGALPRPGSAQAPVAQRRDVVLGYLPAIPFVVVR